MRTAGIALLCALAVLTTGCGDLISLHPLVTKDDQVFDPTVEGRWEDNEDLLVVQRVGDLYRATLQSKTDASETEKYEVRFVDVNGVRFADLIREDSLGHMFLRTLVAKDELHLSFLDSDWLRKRVPHEESEVDGGKTQSVLTARTPQLRSMVAKYAREPKAYDEHDLVYKRAK
jgi:hypothetical protein